MKLKVFQSDNSDLKTVKDNLTILEALELVRQRANQLENKMMT